MPTLTTKTQSIHYIDHGERDTLLLLHAFPLSSAMWKPQIPALSAVSRVIAPDARGFGGSRPVADAVLTMDTIADDARTLIDAFGISRVVIGGLSMGGYGALAFWRRHRAKVRAMILADTRATPDSDEGRTGRHTFATKTLELGAEWVVEQMASKLQRLSPIPEVDQMLRSMILATQPEGVAAAQRGMAVRPDSTAMLAEIDCPVLVIVGAEDSLVPPVRARKMADAIPNARVVEIAGAGHISNLEQPEAFNEAVVDFIRILG